MRRAAALFLFLPLAGIFSAVAAAAEAPPQDLQVIRSFVEAGFLSQRASEIRGKTSLTLEEAADWAADLFPEVHALSVDSLRRHPKLAAEDLEGLLDLVRRVKDGLWARKVPVWSYEQHLKKAVEGRVAEIPAAAPAELPERAVSPEEWEALKRRGEALQREVEGLASRFEELSRGLEKDRGAIAEDRRSMADDLALMRKLLESLQDQLRKNEARLEEVGKKAEEAATDEIQFKQTLTVLRKDVRDNRQDLSVLQQKVERLMSPEKKHGTTLDKALRSKWMAGAALLLSVGAVVLTASD